MDELIKQAIELLETDSSHSLSAGILVRTYTEAELNAIVALLEKALAMHGTVEQYHEIQAQERRNWADKLEREAEIGTEYSACLKDAARWLRANAIPGEE